MVRVRSFDSFSGAIVLDTVSVLRLQETTNFEAEFSRHTSGAREGREIVSLTL